MDCPHPPIGKYKHRTPNFLIMLVSPRVIFCDSAQVRMTILVISKALSPGSKSNYFSVIIIALIPARLIRDRCGRHNILALFQLPIEIAPLIILAVVKCAIRVDLGSNQIIGIVSKSRTGSWAIFYKINTPSDHILMTCIGQ